MTVTALQSFMKTLLNNYEGAPPEIFSDNARLLQSSCRVSGCSNKKSRRKKLRRQEAFDTNEANTQGKDNIRLTRWGSTNIQSPPSGTGRGHKDPFSYLPPASPQRRESSNILIPKKQLAPLLTSRNLSCTSIPLLHRHASLPPICPRRTPSLEMVRSVLA
jgi:hypothetical protein